jgi:dipeptidyl aminopeptidase/acylaminoacyl peptidase
MEFVMKQLLIFVYFTLISTFSYANAQINDAESCFRGPFESHEKWLSILSAKKKNFNKAGFLTHFPASKFNQRKDTLDCIDFTYQVDGFTVEGYYLKPKQQDNKKLPLVIFNRGGNADYGYVVFGTKMDFIADIATGGYVVIGSQYRGSSSRFIANNGKDEFGGSDVNDVTALVALAATMPDVDTSKIALVGWSRGVMESYLAATKLKNVKAIVSIAGNADAAKALKWRPDMEKIYQARVPNFLTDRANELAKRSVIKWIDKLPPNSPILLIHGTDDIRVNVEQSKLLAAELTEQAYPHKLVIYDGDDHGLRKNRADLIQQTLNWLDSYL